MSLTECYQVTAARMERLPRTTWLTIYTSFTSTSFPQIFPVWSIWLFIFFFPFVCLFPKGILLIIFTFLSMLYMRIKDARCCGVWHDDVTSFLLLLPASSSTTCRHQSAKPTHTYTTYSHNILGGLLKLMTTICTTKEWSLSSSMLRFSEAINSAAQQVASGDECMLLSGKLQSGMLLKAF